LALPRLQVSVLGRFHAEVVVQFAVNVGKGAGERADVRVDGERQSNGVANGGVGVLSHNENLDVGQGLFKGTENRVPGRQIATVLGDLSAQEVAHAGDLVCNRFHCVGPVGGHDVSQSHILELSAGRTARVQILRV